MCWFCSLQQPQGAKSVAHINLKSLQAMKKSIVLIAVTFVLLTFVSCSIGYKNDGKEVTWHTWNEGSGHNSQKVDADPETFEILNDDYGRDKTYAFYRGDIIRGADCQSFRVLEKGFAVDKFNVYDEGVLMKGADPTSFKIHSYELTEDKKDFYNNGKALNVRDKSSFEILKDKSGENTSWGKDKNNGYYLNGTVIPNIDYATFHPIDAERPIQSGCYAADKYRVFFMGKEIPEADPATFKEVDFYIGQDKNRAYQREMPTQIKDYTKLSQIGRLMYSDGINIYDLDFHILQDADVATFEHISANWYKDESHVWWSNKLVNGADPKTFRPVPVSSYYSGNKGTMGGDFNYGKDDKHVFWNDSIIPGADAASFEKVDFPDGDSWTVFDRNRVYKGKDSPKLREYLKKKYGKLYE